MPSSSESMEELFRLAVSCFETKTATQPFANPDISQADAYRVQYRLLETLVGEGRVVTGHKVALTTKIARTHLGVSEPCFGHILDQGVHANNAEVSIENLADPHIEAEIAFLLGEDLKGPGITPVHVIKATRAVLPALEIVDLKVQGEGIQATDVIIHNALHGGVVAGSRLTPLDGLDLQFEGVTMEFNGNLQGSGTGFEVMDNPINPIVWLANKLAEFDDYLKAGELIISGSVVAPIRIAPGDHVRATYTRLGSVSARFV